jgi:hypothetical protein
MCQLRVPKWFRLRLCGFRSGESALLLVALTGLSLYTALFGEALRSTISDPGGICEGDFDLGWQLGVWLSVDGGVGTALALCIVIVSILTCCGDTAASWARWRVILLGTVMSIGIVFLVVWSLYGMYIVFDGSDGMFHQCDELLRVLAQVVMYFQLIAVIIISSVLAYAFRRLLLRDRCCQRYVCCCCTDRETPELERRNPVNRYGV